MATELTHKSLTRNISLSKILSSTWIAAISVAAFWMSLILIVHRDSPRTLVSFHGLLHAAIGGQFLTQSSSAFPPENPFYAGQPLAYYWFFQFLAAQITRVFNLNIFYSFELLILLATGGMMMTAVFLGRRLYSSLLPGILIGYLIVAGTNPLGWLYFINNLVRRGPQILNDNPNHLWGVVHPLYSLIRYNDMGGLYGPLLNFFLNTTSRPAALAFLLVMVLCLEWLLRSHNLRAALLLCCASAMTTALSPIIGISAGTTLLLSFAVFYVWHRTSRLPHKTQLNNLTMFYAGLAIFAGLIIAAPTYYHLITGPSSSAAGFSLFSLGGLRHLVAVTASVSVLLILAVKGLVRAVRAQKDWWPLLAMLITSALVLLGLDAVIVLPAGNQSNFFHAAVVFLTVPAAGSIVRPGADAKTLIGTRFAAVIFLIFLPTLLLLVASYLRRPPMQVNFDSQTIARTPENSDLAHLYQWVRDATDPRSVFILDPRERVAVCGNSAEFPAMTKRAIFTENRKHYLAEPYADSGLRYEIAKRFVSGEKPLASDLTYLSQINRPLYLLIDSDDDAKISHLQDIYGRDVFRAGKSTVFELRPPAREINKSSDQ